MPTLTRLNSTLDRKLTWTWSCNPAAKTTYSFLYLEFLQNQRLRKVSATKFQSMRSIAFSSTCNQNAPWLHNSLT